MISTIKTELFTDTRRKFGKALPKLSAEFNMQN